MVHVLEIDRSHLGEVTGEVDWTRRFDHMQQHTGQHLLSAVFEELFGIWTVSFHMGASGVDHRCERGASGCEAD